MPAHRRIDTPAHRREDTPAHRSTSSNRTGLLGQTGKSMAFVFLLLMILAALVLIVVPRVTGSTTYTVLTSSMEPGYPPGTLLVIKPQSFDSLRTGDVVTYQIESGKPDVITHRIVSLGVTQKGERTLIAKGDNNSQQDREPVREVQVRGKLFYAVPYAGFVANAVGQHRNGAAEIAAAGLIGYGLFTTGRGMLAGRKLKEPHRGRRRIGT